MSGCVASCTPCSTARRSSPMADRRPEPSKTLSRRKTPVAPRRVTVVDVARDAGVSPMTVSNVVNGHHRLMSEATRRLVEAAIERLGYRPPVPGRSLRLDRRFAIALGPAEPAPTFLAHPFLPQRSETRRDGKERVH